MSNRFPVGRDVFERVLWTFLAATLTPAVADGVGWINWGSLANWQSWLAGGMVAAFTLVKSLIATQIGKVNGEASSASTDPAVKLQPVQEVQD